MKILSNHEIETHLDGLNQAANSDDELRFTREMMPLIGHALCCLGSIATSLHVLSQDAERKANCL